MRDEYTEIRVITNKALNATCNEELLDLELTLKNLGLEFSLEGKNYLTNPVRNAIRLVRNRMIELAKA